MYVQSTRNIISSYNVVSDESCSSALAYTSQTYSESMAMRPSVTYTHCATSPGEQTVNIIMFAQFAEGGLLSETRNNAESGEESYDDSIILPLLSEEEMYAMDSGDE